MGPFEPVSVPVIKLTAQTGMVVCKQHRTQRPALLQSSAPELNKIAAQHRPTAPHLTNEEINAASLRNIINTGSLGAPQLPYKSNEQIVQLENSPYLYRRSVAAAADSSVNDASFSVPSAPPLQSEGGGGAAINSSASSHDDESCAADISEEENIYDTFEVQMACHR